MQLLNYYIGVISRQTIMLLPSVEIWASEWMYKADQAERVGNQLIVIEIPKDLQVPVPVDIDTETGLPEELRYVDAELFKELLA